MTFVGQWWGAYAICIQVYFGQKVSTSAIAGWLKQKWRGVRLEITQTLYITCEWQLMSEIVNNSFKTSRKSKKFYSSRCGGPRFDQSMIRLNAYRACAMIAFICCDALGLSGNGIGHARAEIRLNNTTCSNEWKWSHKLIHFYLSCKLSNEGESWLSTNLGPLPSRSQIRTNPGLVESGTTTPPMGKSKVVSSNYLLC